MTSAIGVFNYAESYRKAAAALNRGYDGWSHEDAPTRFLFIHSCELFLKSYLWDEIGTDELKAIGHKLAKLHRKARSFGLPDTPWADYAFSQFDFSLAITERYLETGLYKNRISTEALSYLSAELCVATHKKQLEVMPNLSELIKADQMLDAEDFVLPKELRGSPS
jgi:hypothetical protein